MNRSVQFIKLACDPRQPGLVCRKDGLALAGHPLLYENDEGLSPRPGAEIQAILNGVYGWDSDIAAEALMPGLASVARFLDKGDLPLAMIASLLLKLPDIPDSSALAKAGYDPAQARDENGRWTQGARSRAFEDPTGLVRPSLPEAPVDTTRALPPATAGLLETEGQTGGEMLADLSSDAVALIARFGPYLTGAVATVIGVLIPTNRSNIHEGAIPDAPGLRYRSDEGFVDIYSVDQNGNPVVVYRGVPDRDGFYYDAEGLIIGRYIGTAVLFDPESLEEMAAAKQGMPADSDPPAGNPPSIIQQPSEDRPRFCPPPTPENITRRSIWSVFYQSQITGLPPGFDVLFQGVRFDGCVEATRHFQEAKARMPRFLTGASDKALRKTKFYTRIMRQASRQSSAASMYYDDWYFADERLFEFFTREFRLYHFDNLITHHVDAIFFRKMEDDFASDGISILGHPMLLHSDFRQA
jgi:hypothetical protein